MKPPLYREFNQLLYLFDWHIRNVAEIQASPNNEAEDYACGYADAIGQVILDLGRLNGEKIGGPYQFEAYKRICELTSAKRYVEKYPKPVDLEVLNGR